MRTRCLASKGYTLTISKSNDGFEVRLELGRVVLLYQVAVFLFVVPKDFDLLRVLGDNRVYSIFQQVLRGQNIPISSTVWYFLFSVSTFILVLRSRSW